MPPASYAFIDREIVAIFSEGLWDNAIRAKVIRGKPLDMNAALKGFYSKMFVKNTVLEQICGHFYFSGFPKVITLSKSKKNSKFGVK